MRAAYPGSRLLIVSNSAGTWNDIGEVQADMLQASTGVHVLRHDTKKPGCGFEIMEYFRKATDSKITKPSQIAIVGDRLFTDVLMANMMGSWSVWVKGGVVQEKSPVSTFRAVFRGVMLMESSS